MKNRTIGELVKTKLTPRNPFKMDEGLINYDQDSDEEVDDMMGENIDIENADDEQMEEADSLYEDGFIV
jgi:hypothetical protein